MNDIYHKKTASTGMIVIQLQYGRQDYCITINGKTKFLYVTWHNVMENVKDYLDSASNLQGLTRSRAIAKALLYENNLR